MNSARANATLIAGFLAVTLTQTAHPLSKRGKFPALTKDEIEKLSGWIAQGVNWPQGTTLIAPEK